MLTSWWHGTKQRARPPTSSTHTHTKPYQNGEAICGYFKDCAGVPDWSVEGGGGRRRDRSWKDGARKSHRSGASWNRVSKVQSWGVRQASRRTEQAKYGGDQSWRSSRSDSRRSKDATANLPGLILFSGLFLLSEQEVDGLKSKIACRGWIDDAMSEGPASRQPFPFASLPLFLPPSASPCLRRLSASRLRAASVGQAQSLTVLLLVLLLLLRASWCGVFWPRRREQDLGSLSDSLRQPSIPGGGR